MYRVFTGYRVSGLVVGFHGKLMVLSEFDCGVEGVRML